jgi:hypothetical protein
MFEDLHGRQLVLTSDTTSSKISNVDMTGNTNAEKVWSFLNVLMAPVPAAGIVQWENYNTKSKRWANMAAYAKAKGKDWTDLQSQLEFLIMELNGDLDYPQDVLLTKSNDAGNKGINEED